MKERVRVLPLLLLGAAALALAPAPHPAPTATATFAGGCFWSMQRIFDNVPGVTLATVGYSGGQKKNPTYKQVSTGQTGHLESVQVVYDPARVSYETLLDTYWHNIDPLQADGQFCDHGSEYHTAIFYADTMQQRVAEQSRRRLAERFKQPIATLVIPAAPFYPAEDYHQHFYRKNPEHYEGYRRGCGQDRRLEERWGKPAGASGAGR